MKLAMSTKETVNTAAGANAAITAPQATPMTAGIDQILITPGMTYPLARCAR